jgi:hypothetical protein
VSYASYRDFPEGAEFGVKNFEKYQHYRRRRPSWIKLYVSFLDDIRLISLPGEARLLYVELLLVAAENDNVIPLIPRAIAMRLGGNGRSIHAQLPKLFNTGLLFIHDPASKALAQRQRQSNTSNTLSKVPSSRTSLLLPIVTEGGGGGAAPAPPLVLVSPPPVRKRAPRPRFIAPTVAEVRSYCETQGFDVDPVNFCASYEAKGWLMGSTPMKNWKAAVVTWVRRQGGYDGNRQ